MSRFSQKGERIAKELIFTFAYYLWQQANINLSHGYNNCSLEYCDGLSKRTQELQLACCWMTVCFKLFQQCYIRKQWPAHMQYSYWHLEATYHNRSPNVMKLDLHREKIHLFQMFHSTCLQCCHLFFPQWTASLPCKRS